VSAATPPLHPTPPRPRLVLRVGFAGSQKLLTDEEFAARPPSTDRERKEREHHVAERRRLEKVLPDVLETMGRRLAEIVPGVPVTTGKEPPVAAFFEKRCPLLRLITGLCEGADALSARMLERVAIAPDPGSACGPDTRCLETELAAVLPFDVESYRCSRPEVFQAEFDRQLARCEWVLALDGRYEKPDPPTPLEETRRSRAYRAQGAFLLRQSDVLVAAANPDAEIRAGGTLETVREALAFELPVVFIHTGTGAVHLVGPDDDLPSVLSEPAPEPARWRATLRQWVTQLTADPDSGLNPGEEAHEAPSDHGERLLAEYFDQPSSPPRDAAGKRKPTRRERVWSWIERRFRSGPDFNSDQPLEPYAAYRRRATDLTYHYGGLYRGAFLLNYALAIVAVALAAISLTLLGTAGHTSVGEQVAVLARAAGQLPEQGAVSPKLQPWLLWVLLALAGAKLGLLGFISRNTRRANSEEWNDRAVNYRYLAERLRAMFYLPLAGSHQPPAAEPPQFASRVVRQSAVDWLFDSLVRAISPADLPHAQPRDFPAHDGRGVVRVKKLLTLDPLAVAQRVRDGWIAEQAKYHDRSGRTMHALHHSIETVAVCLGWAVIAVVAFDLVLVGGKVLHGLPESWMPFAKAATPWLIFVSTVLPAIVAALGGVRFQSECQRLAERSAIMRVMLAGRGPSPPRSQAAPWWREIGKRWVSFWKAVWILLRRLCGILPAPTPFQPHGGRWELADTVARRIITARDAPETDPGSWNHDTLRLTERVAGDFVQEAAEWSVLYAREVSDPG